MALVRCRECGGEVSDQASACPHCGAPVAAAMGDTGRSRIGTVAEPVHAAPKRRSGLSRFLGLALLVALVLLGLFASGILTF